MQVYVKLFGLEIDEHISVKRSVKSPAALISALVFPVSGVMNVWLTLQYADPTLDSDPLVLDRHPSCRMPNFHMYDDGLIHVFPKTNCDSCGGSFVARYSFRAQVAALRF